MARSSVINAIGQDRRSRVFGNVVAGRARCKQLGASTARLPTSNSTQVASDDRAVLRRRVIEQATWLA